MSESRILKSRIGEQFVSNVSKEKYEIIDYENNYTVKIKFNDGTIISNLEYANVSKGKVLNPNFKSVYNLGYFGIGKYTSKNKAYPIWHEIIRRCYSEAHLTIKPSYVDCSIDEKWLNFQNFAEWCENNYIDGFCIDKDILVKGNKIYSENTCCFVPNEINALFTKSNKKRGKYPIGITWVTRDKCFITNVHINGKQKHIGCSKNIDDAFNLYKTAKEKYIKEVADRWKNKIKDNVYQAMYNYKVEITD